MKRFQRISLSVAVALGMLAMVPGAVFAAQPSCGDTLYVNTTLTGDLDCSAYGGTALYMGKKDLTLNLNGYTIWGPVGDDGQTGVDTSDKKHTTIKNGTIANFDTAVYLDQSVGGTVKNLTLIGEYPTDSNGYGVDVQYGTTNTLNNLTIMDFYEGVNLYGSANNWITNNHITGTSYGLYSEYEVGDHIVNNYAEYDYAGFYEDYNGHQWYEDNVANGDPDGGSYGFYMYCDEYGLITMINNTATGNGSYGFYTYNCYDYYNSSPSNHSLFQGNVANDNDSIGFYDYYSINGVWMSNTAKRNGDEGFYMEYPGFVIFKWNIANRNGSDGIYAYNNYSSIYNFTAFANNKANYNDDYGIDGEYGISGASGNIARHNGNAPDNCYNVDCN